MDVQQLTEIGGYRVIRLMAEGGMSWIFEVVDPRFDVNRALKLLKPEAAVGREFERFTAEAKVLARLEHPNVVTIYDFGRDEKTNCFFYTMSLIHGGALSQLSTVSYERVCEIVLDALAGLTEIHNAGIIHRDIKPGNILVSDQGRSYIADLGIARDEGSDPDATGVGEELTRTGMMVGTVLYSSPEQVRGLPVGKTSDVFSMGLTLYKALTGKSVYGNVEKLDSTSGQEVLMYLGSLLHSGTELALSFPKSIPPSIREVIVKACRVHPEHRYQDAREMYDALHVALEGFDGQGGTSSRTPGLALGALLVVLGLGAGLAWWMNRDIDSAVPLGLVAPADEGRSAASSRPVVPISKPLEDDKAERIQTLLVRADEQLALDRLTQPAGNSALDSYRAILSLDPNNSDGITGLKTIRSRQMALGESAEKRGDDAAAMKFYRSAELAAPGDIELGQRIRVTAARIEQTAAAGRDKQEKARLEVEKLRVERLDRERVLREQQAQIEADQREAERLASKRLALEREEAKRQTEARRIAALAAENMAKVNAPKAEMVAVEAGPFRSGKGGTTLASTQAFMIDRTEVTTLAYGRCVADGACPKIRPHPNCNLGQEGRDDHPVNCVSFVQATAYCAWVGKRVPTGNEWEKAARGTGGQAFPWGDQAPNCSHLVARIKGCEKQTGTEPVGSRPDGASPNGAVDMMGNVWEWTGEPEGKHSFFRGGALNKGPVSHIRGGAWNTGPVPVYSLNPYGAKNWTPTTGFRCVR